MSSLAIVGGGAWGCALAIRAVQAGHDVTLWARTAPRMPLPAAVVRASSLAGPGHNITLLAVPVQHLRSVVARIEASAPMVVCAKGVEAATGLLPAEIVLSIHPTSEVAILTGPNFAAEIAKGMPAAAVLAAPAVLRDYLVPRLAVPNFRVYGNDDMLGAQIGGAAKNVIAIAAGAVIGAGLGENARAALITRGIAELARLVEGLGGRRETAFGLSGLGDLLLTCTGAESRNYSLGVSLGRGKSLADVLGTRSAVTEGVATAPALIARASNINLPICTAVAALLAGRTTVTAAMSALLGRPTRDE